MASLVAQMVKHLPTMWEIQVRSLGREDPLEKEMATHSSTLAWKILWMEEPGRLQSMGLQRDTTERLQCYFHFHGHTNLGKCTLCFPSWCFMLYSWKQLVGNLDISLNEIIYVTAVQDGQRHVDFLFITVASPWSLEVAKALPGSSECFLMWLDLVTSV